MTEEAEEGRTRRKFPIKGVLALVVLIAIIALVRILPVRDWLESFNLWVEDLGFLGYIVFFGMYVLSTVLFLPGSVLTLGAGFLFGVVGGSVAVSLSATVGASLAFLIARYLARNAVAERLSRNEKFAAVDSAIGREGGKIVLLLRLSPIFPFNALNYLLGLTAVRFWSYLLASWIGMMPGTVLYVYLGVVSKAGLEAAAGGGEKGALEYAFIGVGLIITLFVTIYVTRIAKKALNESELKSSSGGP